MSNCLIEKCIVGQAIPSLANFKIVRREPTVARGSRVDFLLQNKASKRWVEVKSAFVVVNGIARFPDSVSPRSIKQLRGLIKKVKGGDRAMVIFVTQRGDATNFTVNHERHPKYAKMLSDAIRAGVEVLALSFPMNKNGYDFPRRLQLAI